MANKRKTVNARLWIETRKKPCTVCGVPYFVCADHIIPVACGGDSSAENIQPLCHWCNSRKGHRWNNQQLEAWVLGRGIAHFLYAVYRYDTRHENCYGGTWIQTWKHRRLDRVQYATDLYLAFLERIGEEPSPC